MATLLRSAKSGSDWTAHDLLAYNIIVSSQSPEMFYDKPLTTIESLLKPCDADIFFYGILDPNLLYGTLDTQGLSNETYRL